MHRQNDIRVQLKRALQDLEAARDKRIAGTSAADMRALELRINTLSDAFTRLMEKLIAQISNEVALAR